MASAFGATGADPSIGECACLRRELSGEPDVVNLHLRFDEGRAGRATGVAFSPTLPPSPGKRTRREDHALSHRPQMSSGRLFLDRVARQHCPSPLHRHTQINMHSRQPWAKGDISTLPARGHFYFALTKKAARCGGKVIMSPLSKVEMSP